MDETHQCHVQITNTTINMIHGSIYYSWHYYDSNIDINDVSITTNHVHEQTHHEVELFHFQSEDIVIMNNVNISYSYNLSNSCNFAYLESNTVINATLF